MIGQLQWCCLIMSVCDCLHQDQREAGAAAGEKKGDDVQMGRPMGLAQAL